MKKSILLFFIVLLIIQAVSAEMTIQVKQVDQLDKPESSVYNKGDHLLVSGTILREEAVEGGSLKVKLVCENFGNITELPPLSITVKAQESKQFESQLQVPPVAEGNCYVKVSLLFDEAVIEEKNSGSFEVSDELKAGEEDFQINPIHVQLGKTLTLYGYITNINDEPIKGLATIYFKTEDKTYYASNVDVLDGRLEYSYTATDNKPGEYSINVKVTDLYGNKKLFGDVARFNIVDEVHVFVEPIQKKVLPGSIVKLSGEVNTILGEEIKEGVMQIILESELFSVNIYDGKFDYDLKLPEEIETGKHTLMFSFVEEKTGNWGSAERKIYVEAVPTEIRLNILQDSVKPEDLLNAIVTIYDHAGDEIDDKVNVELVNPESKSIFLDSVESGERVVIEIPQYSIPGIWTLKASYSGLEAEGELTVEEVQDIKIELVNNTLYVTNIGNVDYSEPVSIDLDEGYYTFTKKVSIKPAETLTIDLTEEAPSGQYDVKVTGAAVGASLFSDIVIVGKNKRSLNFIYSTLLIFVVASLAYLSVFKRRHFQNVRMKNQMDVRHAKIKLRKIKAMKEKGYDEKPRFSREESIVDFKQRVLKDINETEEKIKSDSPRSTSSYGSSSEEKKDDEQPKGLFNMFN